MCGIAGIIDFGDRPVESRPIARMLGRINYRGPDSLGVYVDGRAGLGSARLSILDIAGGDQPIHNEDENLWIVYNGEIFNYPELRKEVEDKGHRFYTHTDTEVLVHLFEESGPDMVNRLNGQFAFALWDRNRGSLFMARDRLGVRPLYYSIQGSRLIFGSEIKTIFADESIGRSIDLTALSDIFTCWTPVGTSTPFTGISQLLPGSYAFFTPSGFSSARYWQLSYDRNGSGLSSADELNRLEELLVDACRIRLRADVPVGAYLSGGLDSTLISSIIKKNFNNELRTFSVSFTDKKFDEAPYQNRAVRSIGTDHSMIRCTESDIAEVFPEVVWHAETPLLRTAPAPLFLLSKLVRESDFKVVLTGEGSDELFAGYDIFKEDRIRRFWARVPASKTRPGLFARLYPDIFSRSDRRSKLFLEGFFKKGLLRIDSPVYSHLIRWENTSAIRSFFSRDVKDAIERDIPFSDRFIASLPGGFMKWDPLSRAQYIEINTLLSNYLLSSQGDRVAMAHSVEGRFPFLDYRVVAFACSLPPSQRLRGLKDKYLVRKVAQSFIPPELAFRPKQPYRAPISRCFAGEKRQPYVEELLSERSLSKKGYFNPRMVSRLVEKTRSQDGALLSERENMALVGMLSVQLLDHLFINNEPIRDLKDPEQVRIFDYSPGAPPVGESGFSRRVL